MRPDFLVFSTENYDYFRDALVQDPCFTAGAMTREVFPDGERYQRLLDSVRGRDVVVIGGTITEADTMELYDLAFGLVQHGADQLIMIVPYYGYATMERSAKPGEVITAKTRAVLLSAIPQARVCNEIIMVDLHTGGIPHYFEGHVRPYHLTAKKVITNIIREQGELNQLVLASTDAGRAKWVETLANEIGVRAAFVYKQRISGEQTTIRGINADVRDAHVVIYDDMIRTGGSLVKAGHAYRDAGASRLTAVATHGVLPEGAIERIHDAKLFEHVYLTDTHPRALALAQRYPDFVVVRSLVGEIMEFLKNREAYGEDAYLNTD